MTPSQKRDLSLMIAELIDGKLNDEDFSLLSELLSSDEEARQYYVEHITMASCLRYNAPAYFSEESIANNVVLDRELIEELLEEQSNADIISKRRNRFLRKLATKLQDFKAEKQVRPVLDVQPSLKRKSDRLTITTAVASIAALILLVLYANYFQWMLPRQVATVTASSNAQWSVSSGRIKDGSRLWDRIKRYNLEEGYAQLRLDDGAEVTLFAPSVFYCDSEDSIFLEEGKVHCVVPDGAEGFTVRTQFSKVIDLGTEFSFDTRDAQQHLNVYKGRVKLVSYTDNYDMVDSRLFFAGSSAELSEAERTIKKATYNPAGYYRVMPTATELQAIEFAPVYHFNFEREIQSELLNTVDGSVVKYEITGDIKNTTGPSIGSINNAIELTKDSGITIIDENFETLTKSSPFTCVFWLKVSEIKDGNLIFADIFENFVAEIRLSDVVSREEIIPGRWYMVAMTSKEQTINIYINGKLAGNIKLPAELADSEESMGLNTIVIGAGCDKVGFNGCLDELSLYRKALSDGQIKTLFESKTKKLSNLLKDNNI